MPDPRRSAISVGTLSIQPADAPERWEVRSDRVGTPPVEAAWGEWVRVARRIRERRAVARPRGRGDAWDQGHAAGSMDAADGEAVNPYR